MTASTTLRTRRLGTLLAIAPAVALTAACTGTTPDAVPLPDTPSAFPVGATTDGGDVTTASHLAGGRWATVDEFLTFVLTDVDTFWSDAFAASGLPEPYVNYWWTQPGEQMETGCVDQNGNVAVTHDMTAEYCPADDRIVISTAVATNLWSGADVFGRGADTRMGDFAVAYVVAHEYAHNVQDELEYPQWVRTNGLPTETLELHADCFAGVWANASYYEGQLEAGDVEEALAAAAVLGDYDASDPGFHGTPEQRAEAFGLGYDSGSAQSCNDAYLAV